MSTTHLVEKNEATIGADASGAQQAGRMRPLAVALPRWCRIAIFATLVVLGLGIARELVISAIGTETLLEDLRQLALDVEHSLPAWYSSLLMAGCAAMLLTIARLTARDGGGDVIAWSLLAFVFLAMAMDESVSFHEVLITPVRDGLGTSGLFHFAWVIPGAIGVAVIGCYFLPFLMRLPRRTAVLFAASGAVYVGGALGMEMIGGAMAEAYGKQSLAYVIAFVVEEGLEMAGLTCFFLALSDYVIGKPAGWASLVLAGDPARRQGSSASPHPDRDIR